MIPVAGMLLCLLGCLLLARRWPIGLPAGSGVLPSTVLSLALLAGAVALYVAAYGALRGALIALFVIGGLALVAALAVELRRGRHSLPRPRA